VKVSSRSLKKAEPAKVYSFTFFGWIAKLQEASVLAHNSWVLEGSLRLVEFIQFLSCSKSKC
jgi:hypothetical protein